MWCLRYTCCADPTLGPAFDRDLIREIDAYLASQEDREMWV